MAVAADVSDLEQVKRYVRKTLDTYGRIDGFFNSVVEYGQYGI
jgi:NAD(P)-dependent dehydrogenase (short-subunit alcohol dehydrogenase family)